MVFLYSQFMESQDQDPNKKRRARNDPNNRDYGCPCGKSYLSYPALFTHVKQKHNGKAPGPLIKPKNENTKRGRPRGNSINALDDEDQNNKSQTTQSKLAALLENKSVQHSLTFELATTEADNCNSIFTRYIREANQLSEPARRIVEGFMWLLRKSLEDVYQEGFCDKNNAKEIVEICNDFIDNKREQYAEAFPIERELLIKLTVIFFEWLYKNNLTNHKIEEM